MGYSHSSSSISASGSFVNEPAWNILVEVGSAGLAAGHAAPVLENPEAALSLSRRAPAASASEASFFRTLSSKPGRLERCFLNGEPTTSSSPISAGIAEGMADCDDCDGVASSMLLPFGALVKTMALGTSGRVGVVAGGLTLRSCSFGDGTLSGSAECWRFS
jgi:hypothetical protein